MGHYENIESAQVTATNTYVDSQVTTALTAQQAILAQTEADLAAARTEVTTLQSQVSSIQSELALANTNNATLQSQLTTANTQNTTLQAQVAAANARIAALESQLATVQAQLATANATLATRTQERDAALAQVTTLQGQVTSLQNQIVTLNARIEELENANDPDPAGWTRIYDSTFQTNDGWTARQETQANDGSYNTPNNVSYTPDGMVILGKKEVMGGRNYTTADVTGQHIVVPNYFRAEVEATCPTEFGMWPAPLWFRPLNSSNGEIDVMESWTYDWNTYPEGDRAPEFRVALHDAYANNRHVNAGLAYSRLPNPDPAAKHTYVVEKIKDSIGFWCDGVLVYKWTRPFNATLTAYFDQIFEVPDRTWYPRVTLQIKDATDQRPRADWTQSKMTIHRMKIWKQA